MAQFRYQALNANQDVVAGEIQADHVSQAIALLEADGLVVQSIASASHKLPPALAATPVNATGRPAVGVERGVLQPFVARAVERGRAIAPALRAFAEELPRGPRRHELLAVIQVLERGDGDEAIAALQEFPEYWIPLLSSAATSGDPGHVLSEFIEHAQRADELRRGWSQVLAYPIVVACLAAAVFIALSLTVIPNFEAIFVDFGLSLPALTRIVINLAAWFTRGQGFFVVALLVAGGVILLITVRSQRISVGRWVTDHIGSPFGRSAAVAQVAGYTADLLEAGLDTVSALAVAAFATRKASFRRAASKFAESPRADDTDANLGRRPLSATIVHALLADVPTPSRVRLLRKFSNCYADRSGVLLSWSRGLAAPLATFAIGLIVGLIVIGLFSPLLSLISNLSS